MANVPHHEPDRRRRADRNQEAYDLGNDLFHRLTMRPGCPVCESGSAPQGLSYDVRP